MFIPLQAETKTLTGQMGGNSILLGPLSGFNYAVEITSETDTNCSYTLTGEAPCAVTSISKLCLGRYE